jgi:hypothetical protein
MINDGIPSWGSRCEAHGASYSVAGLFSTLLALVCVLVAPLGCATRTPDTRPFCHLFPVEYDDRVGFIDRRGRLVIEPRFASSSDLFWNGLLLVRDDSGKCGYIGTDGELVIPIRYANAHDFQDGLAFVQIGNKWGAIDSSGRVVVPARFDDSPRGGGFSQGLAPVKLDGKFGYIDRKGDWVIQPRFDYARNFSEGLAAVGIGNKWGYIDLRGELVGGQVRFESAGPFREGVAAVYLFTAEGYLRAGYLQKDGEFAIKPRLGSARDFSEGLARVRFDPLGKYYYIRKDGSQAFESGYSSCGDFNEGLAWIETEQGYGFVDKEGRVLIQPRFDWAASFLGGLAPVGGRSIAGHETMGWIDKYGEYIWGPNRIYSDKRLEDKRREREKQREQNRKSGKVIREW